MIYLLDEIEKPARAILEFIQKNSLRLVCFDAPMGAGKTTLVKAILRELGTKDTGSSPTFSVVNEYLTNGEKFYHIDLYRINDLNEAFELGIEEYLDANNLIFIEWPNVIMDLIDEPFAEVKIEVVNEYQRKIVILLHE